MSGPRPFRVQIEEEQIALLRARLSKVRWPDEVNDENWSYGMRADYLRKLFFYWRDQFDWRAAEDSINDFDQFLVEIDRLDLHFIHQRSPHEDAMPLILTHGWPGSIVEFLGVIPRLTNPEQFGGKAEDAFHIVCPSLPGYAYSSASSAPGMHPGAIAARHAKLMGMLGYKKYVAQGGDWGSRITRDLAQQDPEHCCAIHLNLLPAVPPAALEDPMTVLSERDRTWLKGNELYERSGKGYMHIQNTRPQTLAYALHDSPVGLCAWIAEKFHFWTDCERDGQRDVRNAVSWDQLLANVSLYWFTGTIASSMRLYREFAEALARREVEALPNISTPTGIAMYPGEIVKCPRAWAERSCKLIHWFEADRGGHFAAMEQPQVFSEDLWCFHREIRDRFDTHRPSRGNVATGR
jgi:pimeloyl-ACP methyl ester carboxylesterase